MGLNHFKRVFYSLTLRLARAPFLPSRLPRSRGPTLESELVRGRVMKSFI